MTTPTKISSLESKQYFDEYKESTKLERDKISSKDDLSEKQKKALTNLLHDDMIAKQGTEDFKKHAETRKADYKKIRELVIERVGDPKKVTKEDMQKAVDFFYGNFNKQETKEKKETKETVTKSLEFEENTFKINSKGFEEVTEKHKDHPLLKKFVGCGTRVKANKTGDVVEYLDGDQKGEQIFITYDAFIREVMKDKKCSSKEEVEKKYLMTLQEFKEKMKDKESGSEEYKEFAKKEIKKNMLAGCWHPGYEKFYYVGGRSCIWLVGGGNAYFYETKWAGNYYDSYSGFSGRLLKN